MQIFNIDPAHPDTSVVVRIAELLKSGGVIAYPTDTYYGLGADIQNEPALKRVFDIKGRQSDKPILILISDREDLRLLIAEQDLSMTVKKLMDELWPGPLTLVFQASAAVPDKLTGNTGKIGVRLPDHPFCRVLVERLGRPITATSANISGMPSLARPEDVADCLGESIDALVDGGITRAEGESTVIDVSGSMPVVLRRGCIPESRIMKIMSGERS